MVVAVWLIVGGGGAHRGVVLLLVEGCLPGDVRAVAEGACRGASTGGGV